MIDKCNFFYASDLAQLYNISKQTLIFYDKKDLFKPDYVDSNGLSHVLAEAVFHLGNYFGFENNGLPP